MSKITISSVTLPNWNATTVNPKLRFYLDRAFVTSDGHPLQPGSPGGGQVYLEVTCTLAGTTLTIPALDGTTYPQLDSTTDGQDVTNAHYIAIFFTANNAQLFPYVGFESFRLNSIPSTQTWAQIRAFNFTLVTTPDNSAYTKAQADARFAMGNFVDLTTTQSNIAGLKTFTSALTAPVSDKGGQVYDINAYGADRTGAVDSAAAFRAAITANEAAGGGGVILIPGGVAGGTYLLSTASGGALATITKNVSIVFTDGVKLKIAASVGATTDVFLIKPAAGYTMDALRIEGCYIEPVSGTPARHAFNFDLTNATSAVRKHWIGRCVVKQLGGRSVNVTVNHTDAYFTNVFEDNWFFGPPIFGDGTGDSIIIRGGTITSSVTDQALEVTQAAGSTSFVMENVNFTAPGGVIFHAAIKPLIVGGIYELGIPSLTTAATLGIINFAGDVRTISCPTIRGAFLGADGVVVNGIRVNAADSAVVENVEYNLNAGSFFANITASATTPFFFANRKITGGGSGDGFTGAGTPTLIAVGSNSLGIGTTVIPTWATLQAPIMFGANNSISGNAALGVSQFLLLSQNSYLNASSVWTYITTDLASNYYQQSGMHSFRVAPSGAAGTAITWVTSVNFLNNGNVGIGTATTDRGASGGRVLNIESPSLRSNIELVNTSTGITGFAGQVQGYNGSNFLAGISFVADGAVNSGKINLATSNAGSANVVAVMDHLGTLDMIQSTGAFIPPRLTTTQRDALTAVDGMLIYNTTTGALNYRKAGVWTAI